MAREIFSGLPLIAISIPLFAFIMIICAGKIAWWRNTWSVIGSAGTLVAVVLMYPFIKAGNLIIYELPMIITPLNLTFRVDGFGFLVALITSFIWLMATIFALEYMNHEKNQGRFFLFFLLTLVGTVGVPLAGDLLSLLLFFELMSLASYVLVIHNQSKEAFSAGDIYLYLGVFGGMCLLTAMGLIYFNSGSLDFTSLVDLNHHGSGDNLMIIAMALLLIGFGIKAGMVPLHIWLPKAHPVAPAPASALLSGVMIKAGAYGIIRTLSMIYMPGNAMAGHEKVITEAVGSLWAQLTASGYIMIWIGIITMFFGVCMALLQNNIKKLLACSSISQIGYIIMGAGVAAYLGYDGAMGLAGSTYHILNHAFFKSTLFLAAGAIAYLTGELDLSRLGGLRKKLPFTSLVVLIASLGIIGFPLFNGYASKTMLHHAIVEAYEHHHWLSLYLAEKIFTITSAGTVCYFLKFLYFAFWRPAPDSLNKIKSEPLLMKISMGTMAVVMVLIGFSPNFVLKRLIGPALSAFSLNSHAVEHLLEINFWKGGDLLAVALALGLGILFFYLAQRTTIYRLRIPYWLGADYLGGVIGRAAILLWYIMTLPFLALQNISGRLSERFYRRSFSFLQSVDYRPGQSAIFRTVNISNIDFSMILVLVSLSIILVVVFYIRFGMKIFSM
jgi:hydrogenase-4 component B